MTFTFNGTALSIIGTMDPTPSDGIFPATEIVIDSGTPNATTTTVTAAPQSSTLFNYPWYFVSGLQPTQHTLVAQAVTIRNDLNKFWVDYIQYTPVQHPAPTSTTNADTTHTSTTPATSASADASTSKSSRVYHYIF